MAAPPPPPAQPTPREPGKSKRVRSLRKLDPDKPTDRAVILHIKHNVPVAEAIRCTETQAHKAAIYERCKRWRRKNSLSAPGLTTATGIGKSRRAAAARKATGPSTNRARSRRGVSAATPHQRTEPAKSTESLVQDFLNIRAAVGGNGGGVGDAGTDGKNKNSRANANMPRRYIPGQGVLCSGVPTMQPPLSEQSEELTLLLPPGPLGADIQKSSVDGSCVVAKSGPSSPLEEGDVIMSLNGTVLVDMEGGVPAWAALITASAGGGIARTMVVRRSRMGRAGRPEQPGRCEAAAASASADAGTTGGSDNPREEGSPRREKNTTPTGVATKADNAGIPGAGADPLDRLLAHARAAVIDTIACHVRIRIREDATDGRAEIDRIVDRFRPSFPWLDGARTSIEQAAAANVAGNLEEAAGGTGSRKRRHRKVGDATGPRRRQKRSGRGLGPGGMTAEDTDKIEGAREIDDCDDISKRKEELDRTDNDADLDGETSSQGGSAPPNDCGGGWGSGGPMQRRPAAVAIPWSERIAACRAYYAKHGHLDVKPKDADLGHYSEWFSRIRLLVKRMEKGRKVRGLDASRLAQLREVGFRSKVERRADRFQCMFAELEKYKADRGHCNFLSSDTSELAKWVRETKKEYSSLLRGEQSPISSTEIAKLKGIGLGLPQATRGKTRKWGEWMELCRSFLAENGHLKIPRTHPTLGSFCGRVRNDYKHKREGGRSSLTDERERELDGMGFVWLAGARLGPDGRRLNRTFDEWFELLMEFREEHGHVAVPQYYADGLGAWVAHMRTAARCLRTGEGELRGMTHERYMRLADVGFVFDVSNLGGRRRSSG